MQKNTGKGKSICYRRPRVHLDLQRHRFLDKRHTNVIKVRKETGLLLAEDKAWDWPYTTQRTALVIIPDVTLPSFSYQTSHCPRYHTIRHTALAIIPDVTLPSLSYQTSHCPPNHTRRHTALLIIPEVTLPWISYQTSHYPRYHTRRHTGLAVIPITLPWL